MRLSVGQIGQGGYRSSGAVFSFGNAFFREDGPLGLFIKVDAGKATRVLKVFACGDAERVIGNVTLAAALWASTRWGNSIWRFRKLPFRRKRLLTKLPQRVMHNMKKSVR